MEVPPFLTKTKLNNYIGIKNTSSAGKWNKYIEYECYSVTNIQFYYCEKGGTFIAYDTSTDGQKN